MAGFVQAIGVDLDGTLTQGSALSLEAMDAIAGVRERGIAVVLVTGRILRELHQEFPGLESSFDAVVAENGAVMASGTATHDLAVPVDEVLVDALIAEGKVPVRRGRVILACDAEHLDTVVHHIERLELDCQLLRNRSALMVLPAGVSKGTGLLAALADLRISAHNAIAIGDAENDLAFLDAAEVGVAVANSVSSLRRHADLVLDEPDGRGVASFLDGPVVGGEQIVRPNRRRITIGSFDDGGGVAVPGAQVNILICGDTGSGKSRLAGLLVERWVECGYSVLVLDKEGDHVGLGQLPEVMVLAAPVLPTARGLSDLFAYPAKSVVLDLSGLSQPGKATYLSTLRPVLEAERVAKGVPHWIVVEEAQDSLGATGLGAHGFRPGDQGYCLVTYRPEELAAGTRAAFHITLNVTGAPSSGGQRLASTALYCEPGAAPRIMTVAERRTSHRRHLQKYLSAPLPPELWFMFRHPDGRIVGTAKNIADFDTMLQFADPVVLENHLARGDFSRWLTDAIQDHDLAAAAAAAERNFAGHRSAEVERARDHLRTNIAIRYPSGDTPPKQERTSTVGTSDPVRDRVQVVPWRSPAQGRE